MNASLAGILRTKAAGIFALRSGQIQLCSFQCSMLQHKFTKPWIPMGMVVWISFVSADSQAILVVNKPLPRCMLNRPIDQ